MEKTNVKLYIKWIFIFLFLATTAPNTYGQKGKSVKKQQKEFFKKEKEREKASQKEMEEKKEQHIDLQTKDVQKRMKRQKKRSERTKAGKPRDPFLKRLFTKKPR